MELTRETWQIIIVALTLVIFLAFVRQQFVKEIKRLNKKIDELEKENDELASSQQHAIKQVKEFFKVQKEVAKEQYRKRSGQSQFEFCLTDSIESQVTLLRAYYLKAELIALKWIEDDQKYWLSLTKSLQQVFANLGVEQQQKELAQKLKQIKVLEKKLELAESDDELPPITQTQLIHNTLGNIGEINKSINEAKTNNQQKHNILSQLVNKESIGADYAQNVVHLRDSVEASESEIDSLQAKITALTNEIEFLKGLKSDADSPSLEFESDFIRKNASSLTDNANKQNVINQISMLRENNEQQRSFIVKLRNDILALEKEVSSRSDLSFEDMQEKLTEIQHLEKIITEFEHCVYSLESEIELLHRQLTLLESNEAEAKNVNSVEKTDQNELSDIKAVLDNTMQMYGDQSILTEFAMAAAQCEKIIDLLVVINNSFNALGVVAAFHIRTEIAHNKSLPDGFLSSKEESLLTQNTLPKGGEQFSVGGKMFYWDNHVTLIVGDFPKSAERKTQIIDTTALLKNLIASEVTRIESSLTNQRQHKTILRLLGATQKELSDIEIQQNYQNMEFHNILESLFQQIGQIKQINGLPPEVNVLIDNLQVESKIRSDVLKSTGSLVSTGFTNLIEGLNKKLTKEKEHK